MAQPYGPFYGGLLDQRQRNLQRDSAENQSLRGTIGLLSTMEAQKQQAALAKYQATQMQRSQEAIQGLLQQPDAVVQSALGMPRDQATALFYAGGPAALSKVLQDNAKVPDAMRMIRQLPQDQQQAAIRSKTGIAPSFHTMDTGGAQTGYTFDPVSGGASPVFNAPKTAAPAARPVWMNQDGTVNEDLYSRTKDLRKAGAAAAPSLTINSPLLPGKEGMNKVDTGILDSGQQMSSMRAIESLYKPEYQQLGTKWSTLKSSWKERLGIGIDAEDKALLSDFTRYRGRAAASLNSYIKAITGAALSEMEAERIMKAVPVAGNGMFDGDSPTEFKSKMDSVLQELRIASARYAYIKRRGFALTDVSLEQMPQIMRSRRDEIAKEIKAQNGSVGEEELRNMTKRRLADEFGLVYEG